MSFRINNNISSLASLNILTRNSEEMNRSMLRLSTGKRINSAADDPAGLIQATGFRAQIGGIEQAILNNSNAKNFASTADGALAEVNSLLDEARRLAVANGDGTLSQSQRAANQRSLADIQQSVTRIAQQTQFGDRTLLDGSAGVNASVTRANLVSGVFMTGTFNSAPVTSGGAVGVNVTAAAEQAVITGTRTYAAGTATVGAGSFSLNGTTFTTSASSTVQEVLDMVNAAQGQTGVVATHTATQGIVLRSTQYGSNARIELNDAAGIFAATPAFHSDAGANAVASVTLGSSTVVFDRGEGLTLRDVDGNAIQLTVAGNAVANHTGAAQVTANASTFQIGGNAGQTATLSIGNFAAANLGTTAVSGLNLGNVTINSATEATNALRVIDEAIAQVTAGRGDIGSFVRNTVESNTRSLTVAKQNLTASMSAIEDIDQAQEFTNFTKLQILQQASMSMLAQANMQPQSILQLMR